MIEETKTRFPIVQRGAYRVSFLTDAKAAKESSFAAVLVFALSAGCFVLADIAGRGWCIPGGRPETGETPPETARREIWEETGGGALWLEPLGVCILEKTDAAPLRVPVFLAEVVNWGQPPPDSESRGARAVRLEDIPACYYLWDALAEAMFAHAWQKARGKRRKAKV